ncbi:hypothetical protein F2Q70_00010670 [Brassica cretica]|uniref:Uncharacterized protein n=1 Tax=Brassica cretica TaxID=69181 RepID=A0A8S9M6C8_BRACR|nr:hypothetical protein F2Q70_00010670 [Brassica cretica]KAF3547817.1 hypothetical protein DY000_02005554 [Brassica cretica]
MASLGEIEESNDLVNHIGGVFRYFIVDVVDPGSTPDGYYDPWVTVTQINPRGRVDGTSDDDEPLQPESTSNAQAVEDLENVQLVENLTVFGHDAVVHSEPEAEVGEFDEDSEDSD